MTARGFDAEFIVIGSGPAAVSAALPLVEAGRRVLMIDGAGDRPPADRQRADWQTMLGDRLEALQPDDDLSPKLRTPTARAIIEPFRALAALSEDDFYAIGALARGGLAQVWGGFVAELDARDLQDWPLSVEALTPSYRAVVERVGVSGARDDDMAAFFGANGSLEPPPPLGPVADVVLARYARTRPIADFSLGRARNALLTQERESRLACDLSLDCLWGCARGALYTASHDHARLRRSANFRLIDGAVATRLSAIDGGWEVALRNSETPLRAPRVVVGAGVFGTLRLVLPLLAAAAPERLSLQHSPVLALPLLVPRRLGGAAPDRGHVIAQLGYTMRYGPLAADYVTGAFYEVAALPPSSFAARLPFGRKAATDIFRAMAPALAVATAYFPGACSADTVRWRGTGDDIAMTVHGGTVAGFDTLARRVQRKLGGIWRRLGAVALPGAALARPGTDAHLGALFPMGSPLAQATDEFGALALAPGLHLVDGSVLPNVSSKPTTLTIMANADRIGRHLATSAAAPGP